MIGKELLDSKEFADLRKNWFNVRVGELMLRDDFNARLVDQQDKVGSRHLVNISCDQLIHPDFLVNIGIFDCLSHLADVVGSAHLQALENVLV